jgi:hypothetical protein
MATQGDGDGIQRLGHRLVGEWTTEATHPDLPSTLARGESKVEWLEGSRFLIFRSRVDHPDFPDSISVLGNTDGLHMHYFDSRGVHRVYDLTVTDDGWEIVFEQPGWHQRLTFRFEADRDTIICTSKLAVSDATMKDDLRVVFRRTRTA